jgi:hypothetical protein
MVAGKAKTIIQSLESLEKIMVDLSGPQLPPLKVGYGFSQVVDVPLENIPYELWAILVRRKTVGVGIGPTADFAAVRGISLLFEVTPSGAGFTAAGSKLHSIDFDEDFVIVGAAGHHKRLIGGDSFIPEVRRR